MKIRMGFVSNSSSASFIITFKSILSRKNISDMIRGSSDYLDKYWEDCTEERVSFSHIMKRTLNPPKEKVNIKGQKKSLKKMGDVYKYNIYTSMFNDWQDVPAWCFIRALSENKFKDVELVEILQTEEEYNTTEKVVKFDPLSWECRDYVADKTLKATESEKKEYTKKQEAIDLEYMTYLSKFIEMSKEEIQTIAKHLLKR